MMGNAKYIRDGLKAMTWNGRPRFVFLDHGDEGCLPVVAASLNPACGFTYDDIDLQHALSQHHWYVGGYKRSFEHLSPRNGCRSTATEILTRPCSGSWSRTT